MAWDPPDPERRFPSIYQSVQSRWAFTNGISMDERNPVVRVPASGDKYLDDGAEGGEVQLFRR